MKLKLQRDDQGVSMIMALLVGTLLTGLIVTVLVSSMSELRHSTLAVDKSASFQAAEAGVDDYLAKLTEDNVYYAHRVHPAESSRQAGALVRNAGQTWTGPLTWTYPSGPGQVAWRQLGNGTEFNLQITAPTAGSQAVRIVSTGREIGSNQSSRRIEVLVRSASVADFLMITNDDIYYEDVATTNGKVYAGIDSSGDRKNIRHEGTTHGNLYAEGTITGSTTYRDGARGYTQSSNPNVRTVIKNPIDFSTFTIDLADIKQAAQFSGGIYLDDASVHGWKLQFLVDGRVTISRCTRTGSHLASNTPSCTTSGAGAGTFAVPAIGAIYANQSLVVSGVVKGRVTVASNTDIVIGGDISYAQPGTDVLGLIARNDMIVAGWVPNSLTWTGAVIAETGRRRSWEDEETKSGTMTFTGSQATNESPYMNMFRTRVYNYDPNLLFLQPPFFPVLEEAYTVLSFRELRP